MVLKNIRYLQKHLFLLAFFLFHLINVFAQNTDNYVEGIVKGISQDKEKLALPAANVYWKNTQTATITDEKGFFKLKRVDGYNHLIVSFVGYVSDTVKVIGNKPVEVVLSESIELDQVDVVTRKKSIETDFLNPIGVKKIGEKELLKAACCNLSESFETNPAVDVSFTDAVTGTKQIMMLGLAGPYTQITRENMPDVRGLSAVYGLTYIPGTWIEGIQLIKGTGSVVNGYESIAGQINVELRRPASMDKIYLNAFANEEGRLEANANVKFKAGKNWSSALLLHGSTHQIKHDRNDDGFLDKPLIEQYVALNRWELRNEHGLHFELGAKGTYIDNIGGQLTFDAENDEGTTNAWGMHLETKRLEGWAKIGKVSLEKPYQSVGLQLSGAFHDQHSYFGLNSYNATQSTFYANLLFQSAIGNTNHKYKAGLSFQFDDYNEALNQIKYDRQEAVPGAFFEYTYSYLEKFNLVVGVRADYHNLFGAFVTPRLHIRYAPTEKTIIRLSGGRGQRTANIISENTGILASSREFIIQGDESDKPYGLNPEVAWNYGINFTQHFTLDYRDGLVSLDFYRTDFENQIVVDLDQNPQQVVFYNLDGSSYSNSFQAQFDYEVVKRLDVRLAYRWYDVKTNYSGVLKAKPLVAENRAFANLAYETRKYWKFDYTINWQGNKRIPGTDSNPEEYQLLTESPDFFTMNFQVTKSWRKLFEVYAGVENLLDYKQENPILASDQPFSPYFESSLVWGPIFGRSFYVGLRYKIK
jgi:outer membrane receptor for ferrienterochelin and colicins